MKIIRLLALSLFLAFTPALRASVPTGKTQQLTLPDQVPDGLARSDWASIRAAYAAGRHAFAPVAGGWQARNPGQQWLTRFDGRGFVTEPSGGGWQWGLELKSYGFPGHERAISGVSAVKAEGQRLTYGWDASVDEWFVNDARGLEHGFTVKERPAQALPLTSQPSTLNFLLAVRGSLVAQVGSDGHGVAFRDATGTTVLNYTGLKVWDADGKALSARFAPTVASAIGAVRLLVEERGARYPITVDPIAQQAYLKASNTGANDFFGQSVAVSGDTVVVGARGESGSGTGVNPASNEGASFAGAAYVFVRSGATWSQQAYLKASNTGANDQFGWSVAISTNTIVVGALGESGSGTGVNPADNNLASFAGAAYVFVRSGATWSQQAYLKALNPGAFDQFGGSVAVSGDTVVVGAINEDGSGTGVNPAPNELATDAGAAYVFVRSGATWTPQAYLKASNTGAGDLFGYSVSVSGNTIVVGAPAEDGSGTGVNPASNEGASGAGAAYVYVRSGASWIPQAYLKASNTGADDQFGRSVAVSGDTVVVGAIQEDGSGTGVNPPDDNLALNAGAAYVYVRSGANWIPQAYLKSLNTGAGDTFGFSVAVSGDMVVVGAPTAPGGFTNAPGAAYLFVRSGTTWSQQAYLEASNAGADDQFGYSVAVSGDTVVVGAPYEDGSGTGLNPPDNNLADYAGAVYVFVPVLNTPPTITCPDPATIGCTSFAGTTATVTVGIGDADNDPLTVSWLVDGGLVNATQLLPAGATSASLVDYPFGFGPHTVKAIVSDGKSQPVTCETTVTVTAHDAPVPSLTSLPTIQGECSASIAETPTAIDVCAAGGLVSGTTTDPLSYTAQGTYTVTWTYTDPHDATLFTTQPQTVVVKDTTPPVVTTATGSLDRTLECGDAAAMAAALALEPTFLDNCAGPVSPSSPTTTQVPDASCATGHATERRWKAMDACGNTSLEFVQTITVQDTTPPLLVCPENKLILTGPGPVTFTTTATDGCDPAPITNFDPPSGSTFPLGTTMVSCEARDACGNTTTCHFTVSVISSTGFVNGSFCTFSQGGFGNAGGYGYTTVLSPNFSTLYPLGVAVGHVGNYHMTFTSADAVVVYLPASGTAAVLTGNLLDPTTTSARVFGGQVLTLRLSRDLSNAGVTPIGFGSVTLCNLVDDAAEDTTMNLTAAQAAALNGQTMDRVLAAAENVLGGNGAVSAYGLSVSQLNALVSLLNLSFDGTFTDAGGMFHPCGAMSAFALAHLCP